MGTDEEAYPKDCRSFESLRTSGNKKGPKGQGSKGPKKSNADKDLPARRANEKRRAFWAHLHVSAFIALYVSF